MSWWKLKKVLVQLALWIFEVWTLIHIIQSWKTTSVFTHLLGWRSIATKVIDTKMICTRVYSFQDYVASHNWAIDHAQWNALSSFLFQNAVSFQNLFWRLVFFWGNSSIQPWNLSLQTTTFYVLFCPISTRAKRSERSEPVFKSVAASTRYARAKNEATVNYIVFTFVTMYYFYPILY